jgi:hypothetical protein
MTTRAKKAAFRLKSSALMRRFYPRNRCQQPQNSR